MSHPDVRLVLILPCLEQDAKWSDAERNAYDHLVNAADEVRYVSEEYTDSCMRERNRILAEEADMLVAYLGRAYSGSAQTVRMATELGKEVYNLYPTLERD